MINVPVFAAFISKIIVILTLTTIGILMKNLLVKIIEIIARIFVVDRGLRQYISLAVSEPTFWIDNLIGFGPNGVRQHTRARAKHTPSFLGAMIAYLLITVTSAYMAALYLGEQHQIAVKSDIGVSPYSYNVTKWAPSSNRSYGLIFGPILTRPNLPSWETEATVTVLSNGFTVSLHVNLSTTTAQPQVNYFYLTVDTVTITANDNIICDSLLQSIYIPGFLTVTNSTLNENFKIGVMAPLIREASYYYGDRDAHTIDIGTGEVLQGCLKKAIIFGYDISSPFLSVPLYILAGVTVLSLLLLFFFRLPPDGGDLSYRVGALGALINSEPLNKGLIIKLWRSEAAGLGDCAQPLAERDTKAELQLSGSELGMQLASDGPWKGGENILHFGMFKKRHGIEPLDLSAAIKSGDIAYSLNNPEGKSIVIAGSRAIGHGTTNNV